MEILIPARGDVSQSDDLIKTLRTQSGVPFSATHAPHRNIAGLYAYIAEYGSKRAMLHIPAVDAADDRVLFQDLPWIKYLCFMDGEPVRWVYLVQRIQGWCRSRRPTLVGVPVVDDE